MAVSRVAWRVRHGGHSVPADDIRRRYRRGLWNFFNLCLPIADTWELHDNVSRTSRLIAERGAEGPVRIADPRSWEIVQEGSPVKEKEAAYDAATEPKVAGIPISEVMDIFAQAGREAYARHKALGIPIVTWRDGKVVEIPPEEIEV